MDDLQSSSKIPRELKRGDRVTLTTMGYKDRRAILDSQAISRPDGTIRWYVVAPGSFTKLAFGVDEFVPDPE